MSTLSRITIISFFCALLVAICLIVALGTPWYNTELYATFYNPSYAYFQRTYKVDAFYIELGCKGSACDEDNLHSNWPMGKYSWEDYCNAFKSDCNTRSLYVAVWVICLISLLFVLLSLCIQSIIYLGAKKNIITGRVVNITRFLILLWVLIFALLLLVVVLFPIVLPSARGGSCKGDSDIKYGLFENFGMCTNAFGAEAKQTKNGEYTLQFGCGGGWIATMCALIVSIPALAFLIVIAFRARIIVRDNENSEGGFSGNYDYSMVDNNTTDYYSQSTSPPDLN